MSCVLVIVDGFGLVIVFIEHLHFVTASNYNAIANSDILYIAIH
jgi:hypothetical protein